MSHKPSRPSPQSSEILCKGAVHDPSSRCFPSLRHPKKTTPSRVLGSSPSRQRPASNGMSSIVFHCASYTTHPNIGTTIERQLKRVGEKQTPNITCNLLKCMPGHDTKKNSVLVTTVVLSELASYEDMKERWKGGGSRLPQALSRKMHFSSTAKTSAHALFTVTSTSRRKKFQAGQ